MIEADLRWSSMLQIEVNEHLSAIFTNYNVTYAFRYFQASSKRKKKKKLFPMKLGRRETLQVFL